MSDPFNHLGSIWCHSEPSDVSYYPNQLLGLDFFCRFLQQGCSNYLPSLQSLVEPTKIPAAVEKTLKIISNYDPASGDHEYDYDQDHMEQPNSPVFNSQSPCTR